MVFLTFQIHYFLCCFQATPAGQQKSAGVIVSKVVPHVQTVTENSKGLILYERHVNPWRHCIQLRSVRHVRASKIVSCSPLR